MKTTERKEALLSINRKLLAIIWEHKERKPVIAEMAKRIQARERA